MYEHDNDVITSLDLKKKIYIYPMYICISPRRDGAEIHMYSLVGDEEQQIKNKDSQ